MSTMGFHPDVIDPPRHLSSRLSACAFGPGGGRDSINTGHSPVIHASCLPLPPYQTIPFPSSSTPHCRNVAKMLDRRANDAIHANGDHTVNGVTSDIAITTHGSDWYWVCPGWQMTMAALTVSRLCAL